MIHTNTQTHQSNSSIVVASCFSVSMWSANAILYVRTPPAYKWNNKWNLVASTSRVSFRRADRFCATRTAMGQPHAHTAISAATLAATTMICAICIWSHACLTIARIRPLSGAAMQVGCPQVPPNLCVLFFSVCIWLIVARLCVVFTKLTTNEPFFEAFSNNVLDLLPCDFRTT